MGPGHHITVIVLINAPWSRVGQESLHSKQPNLDPWQLYRVRTGTLSGEVASPAAASAYHVRVLPALAICALASRPITDWCRQTWLSTLPRA